jgi:tRNA pseudouridine55 synthase
MDFSEIVLVDKPANMTSFGVVARVRSFYSRKLGVKKVKVGHSGTLDPFATGLLVVLIGKATKQQDKYMHQDKEYLATIKLGETSTTGDPEGEITKSRDCFTSLAMTEEKVQQTLQKFVGKITQTPPIYSAIKIDGQRAYNLARNGKSPEMPTRQVEIYELELLEYVFPLLKIRAKVSSGTYIRTLAEDIGVDLGTGAYTMELRRTKIGDFDVKDAKSLQNFSNDI